MIFVIEADAKQVQIRASSLMRQVFQLVWGNVIHYNRLLLPVWETEEGSRHFDFFGLRNHWVKRLHVQSRDETRLAHFVVSHETDVVNLAAGSLAQAPQGLLVATVKYWAYFVMTKASPKLTWRPI